MLVPPASFGIAEEGIYRCSKVETLNLSFLEALNLKTVIFVGGTEPSKFFKDFFTRSSIEWSVIKMADFSSVASPLKNHANLVTHKGISSQTEQGSTTDNNEVTQISNIGRDSGDRKTKTTPQKEEISYRLSDSDDLMLIKSKSLKTIFTKLLDTGNYNTLLVDKTSLVVGLLRKIQKWNIASIINEYRLFAGKNRSYFAETFLEMITIRIEQTIEEKTLDSAFDEMNLDDRKREPVLEKPQNVEIVTEQELCDEPEVPQRLLSIIDEAEEKNRIKDIPRLDNILISDTSTSSSNLGIFGHRYRLSFTQKEQGQFEYYKPDNYKDESNAICIMIPQEKDLPQWFKFQRDMWEQDNIPQIHHFYKEQIYV
ncbi:hypothetical protein RNJ44_00126 [Nakaseomyces bracarensis]|uniref:Uncharacterized protein n=1 Tax=Nakaseomyces bracarensis TaxID=273131 RepID=A0ABR4NT61_9SACH